MENLGREELCNTFKNAANSLTLLYKESLLSNKIAYQDGYKRCLQDLWAFLSSRQSSSTLIDTRDLESFISLQSATLSNLDESTFEENSVQDTLLKNPNFLTFEMAHSKQDSAKNKKKKKETSLEKVEIKRESKHEKLTFILKRKDEEVKTKPAMYKSLDSLAFRRKETEIFKENTLEMKDLKDIQEKVQEISKYSSKKEKELLESRKNFTFRSLPTMQNIGVDLKKNLEMGIPVKLRDFLNQVKDLEQKKLDKKDIRKDKINLKELIGDKQELIPGRIGKWGEFYEELKKKNDWNSEENLPQIEIDALSPTGGMDEEEVPIRVLDIFQDGPISDLIYKDKDSQKIIKYGTPKALLDALIFPLSGGDESYVVEFLYGYRFFMGANDLLDGLIAWYNVDVQAKNKEKIDFLKANRRNIQKKVMDILVLWIKNYWNDYLADKTLYKNLLFFVHCLSQVSFVDYQKISQGIREQWLSWYTFVYVPPFSSLNLGPSTSETDYHILDIEPSSWGNHMFAINKTYFAQIRENCFASLMNSSCPLKGGAFNTGLKLILESFSWFRSVSYYICTIIDVQDSLKKKTKAIQRSIKVCKYLYDSGDYQGVFSIMHGLLKPRSLSHVPAWEGVKQKHINDFKMMYCFIDAKDGYLNYWSNLTTTCIPFFPLHLHEIIRYHDTLETFLSPKEVIKALGGPSSDTLVNFSKFKEIYLILSELEKYRTCKFESKFHICRESLYEMVQHVRTTADFKSCGEDTNAPKSPASTLRKSI